MNCQHMNGVANMDRARIGKQPPRYSFVLNPYRDIRLSKCPTCEKPTHPRKFALFIHADGWGPLILGKTCRYCTHCELVIAHKDEMDAEISRSLSRLAPEAVGRNYLVLGTADRREWQRCLKGKEQTLNETIEHVAEFKRHMHLEVKPGGWYPAGG